jgi:hypothetical protein
MTGFDVAWDDVGRPSAWSPDHWAIWTTVIRLSLCAYETYPMEIQPNVTLFTRHRLTTAHVDRFLRKDSVPICRHRSFCGRHHLNYHRPNSFTCGKGVILYTWVRKLLKLLLNDTPAQGIEWIPRG